MGGEGGREEEREGERGERKREREREREREGEGEREREGRREIMSINRNNCPMNCTIILLLGTTL